MNIVQQEAQTQFDRRATFQRKKLFAGCRLIKKSFCGPQILKKLSNYAETPVIDNNSITCFVPFRNPSTVQLNQPPNVCLLLMDGIPSAFSILFFDISGRCFFHFCLTLLSQLLSFLSCNCCLSLFNSHFFPLSLSLSLSFSVSPSFSVSLSLSIQLSLLSLTFSLSLLSLSLLSLFSLSLSLSLILSLSHSLSVYLPISGSLSSLYHSSLSLFLCKYPPPSLSGSTSLSIYLPSLSIALSLLSLFLFLCLSGFVIECFYYFFLFDNFSLSSRFTHHYILIPLFLTFSNKEKRLFFF